MLGKLFRIVSSGVVGALLDPFLGLAKQYFAGQITKAELANKLNLALVAAVEKMEVANVEALTKTYGTFMDTVQRSPMVARMYVATLGSQLFILCWYQWVVPFGAWRGWWVNYPSPGGTIEWAYLLVGGLCGLAPAMFRGGEGGGGWLGRLRGMLSGRS